VSASLEDRIRSLEDRLEISELRSLYCHYVDQHRWDDLAELFTEDCEFHGRLDLIHGREALVDYFKKAVKSMEASWHRTLNDTVVLEGDHANGATYFDAPCVVGGTPMLSAGIYQDEFARQDGRWRFKSRAIKFFYFTPFSEGWRDGAMPDQLAAR
jgi:hypothetical protein